MKTWALINKLTNVVENIIVWDGKSSWQPSEETRMIEATNIENAQIGGTYDLDSHTFMPAPEPIFSNNTTQTAFTSFSKPPITEPQTEPNVI